MLGRIGTHVIIGAACDFRGLRELRLRYCSSPYPERTSLMVIYVALIAILNLGLGYALATYLGAGRSQLATTIGEPLESLDHSDDAASE
jgi:hypothetical protein